MKDIILAIESSCDDMSAAVIADGIILSNITASQELHERYGGVVPELASRQHHKDIIPVINEALHKAGVTRKQLSAIAFTRGPGLLGSLIVGVSFAKAFAQALNIPLISVNHLHAHVLSHFAEEPKPDFPYLCLTVSGGHSQIVWVKNPGEVEILGTTIDDAAGEAFDKVGKMLGLPYPAGPHIDRLAKKGAAVFSFAQPQVDGYNYSFSGFKTSVLYFLKDAVAENPDFIEENLNDICASVQSAIVDLLLAEFFKAALDTQTRQVALAGGVAANSELRQKLRDWAEKHHLDVFIPAMEYCTDNAGMIAAVAWFKYQANQFVDQSITPDARLKLEPSAL